MPDVNDQHNPFNVIPYRHTVVETIVKDHRLIHLVGAGAATDCQVGSQVAIDFHFGALEQQW